MAQETFMYTICPRTPIRNLIKGEVIRRNQSLMLTAEDVELCYQHGPVYRRFNATKSVRVMSISDIERLHRKEYISEEKFLKMQCSETASSEQLREPEKNVDEEPSRSDETSEVTLPLIHAFERLKTPEYQPISGELEIPENTISVEVEGEIDDNERPEMTEEDQEEVEEEEIESEEEPEDNKEEENVENDLLKELDAFSSRSYEEPEKNVDEELSRSANQNNYSQRSRKKGRKK